MDFVKNKREKSEPYTGLPPSAIRLWNVEKQGKLETPLDELGRADLDSLVAQVKTTVQGGYDWASPFDDVHHLQWPSVHYGEEKSIDREFRELVRRKAYLPRLFHNWTHVVTLAPPVPSNEVMRYSIDAHRTARQLATTAALAQHLARLPEIPDAKLVIRLEEELENYMLYVEQAREVPPEFQLLKLEEVEARSIDEMLSANRRLGKLAMQHIPIVARRLQIS